MFQINFSKSFHQRKDKTFIIAQQQRKRKAVNEILEIFNAESGKSWFYLFFSHSQETKKIILFAMKKGFEHCRSSIELFSIWIAVFA